jgi:DNA topoisomerase I
VSPTGGGGAVSPVAARRDASAIGLRYVLAASPGISRHKAGRAFAYAHASGRPVRDAATLDRIRALAIPPAWTEVWICPDPDGHLQATGRDARGRRQYRYHARFRARRDRGKFARLVRFGDRLPRIRRRVRSDLARQGLPREKVLAAVVALLETTRFRVGNSEYARLNRSFGISTLRDRHATVSGSTVRFRFRGKGGRTEEGELVDRRLATIVRRCQDLPGQELFQYVDDEGETRPISSEDVNEYLREAAGSDEFSAKDFRTWTATVLAHRALREALDGRDVGAATRGAATGGLPKRIVAEALRQTAEALGDTVTVTKSSYVHPAVLEPPAVPDSLIAAPARPRRRRETAAPSRRDELAVLAILRSTGSLSKPTTNRTKPASKPGAKAGANKGARADAKSGTKPSRPARRSIAGKRSPARRASRPAA